MKPTNYEEAIALQKIENENSSNERHCGKATVAKVGENQGDKS